uniref:Uncharacterized protein n=1 Tax=Oryza meridionalis TaxID=40149 RepID=A0A0E0FEM6_9ORYZ
MAPSSHSLATILLKIVASPPPCSHPYHILDIAYSPVSRSARSHREFHLPPQSNTGFEEACSRLQPNMKQERGKVISE